MSQARAQNGTAAETAHLLQRDDHSDQPCETSKSKVLRLQGSRWQASSPGMIVLLAATAKFSVVASGMMILMPIYRLIEDALCHAHFQDDSPGLIDEMECKVDEIQSRLATMMGWMSLVANIMSTWCATVTSFQYGLIRSRFARRLSLWLTCRQDWTKTNGALSIWRHGSLLSLRSAHAGHARQLCPPTPLYPPYGVRLPACGWWRTSAAGDAVRDSG